MRATPALISTLAVLLTGCATGGDPEPITPMMSPSAERGRSIAETRCAACHAVTASLESPRPSAPPFMVLKERYLATTLQRKITAMSETEHSEMPPTRIHWDEIEALMAYMNELPKS